MADQVVPRPGHVWVAEAPSMYPEGKPKARPMILVRFNEATDTWMTMGLTGKPCYARGQHPRVPVADWEAVGLKAPTYLWGGKGCEVRHDSLTKFVGTLDRHTVNALPGVGPWIKPPDVQAMRETLRGEA